ncbi:MAG: adenylosuccinate lyase [Clostridia bacterium]|nr:adenylosuccinate lyase [Clostridia bacterium]
MEELLCISPIDGRYHKITESLNEYFSEYALIKYRVVVEIKWLLKLNEVININFSLAQINALNSIIANFNTLEAKKVKEIEATTKHDVKAIEYYLRDRFDSLGLSDFKNYIHFGCTSEDINNLAYGLMIKNGLYNVFIPSAEELVDTVAKKAKEYRNIPMLAHTHGQPATPTTVGKELAVFVYRWQSILKLLKTINLRGKFSGAVGNFNAHVVSFPNLDWIKIASEFVESLGLEFNPLTTQIESHDIICVIFNYIKSFNNITMDFNSDMWIYISHNYFNQSVVKTEVGSSVMPHKVNPINHENSMANIRIANSIFTALCENLPVSRMQRDLSDSSALRNIGVGFAHSLVSISQSIIGFNKLTPNEKVLSEDLNSNVAVVSEAIQTVLRKNGYTNAYELLKELTRGQEITLQDIQSFVQGLDIPNEDKENLLNLTPSSYLGLADKLVDFI